MEFNEYENQAKETAVWNNNQKMNHYITPTTYCILGVLGESGEIAEKYKKFIRENDGQYLVELEKEMGDLLWYLSQLSREMGIPFERIAEKNLEKIQDRKERDKITGSGDNR